MTEEDKKIYTAFDLAFRDDAFLRAEHNRGLRLMLEYEKPELMLTEAKVASTIVGFGSARVLSPEQIEEIKKTNKDNSFDTELLLMRERQVGWYNLAREFGRIASVSGGALNKDKNGFYNNVIASGGGPGLMEAINRGAHDAGAVSIGFNIYLPFEERPNKYSTPSLTFRFHYFGIRKMHLLLRTQALAVFPGGFGTLDEVMELLNLMTTGRNPVIPIVLFDKKFWKSLMNLDLLVEQGLVSKSGLDLIHYADTAQEGWELMVKNGLKINFD